MHIIYKVLLFITYFGIFIDCQGGGGHSGGSGGGGGGFGGGTHSGGFGTSCTTDVCRRRGGIIAGSIIGGIFGIILITFGVLCCCKRCKGRSFRKNSNFVNVIPSKTVKQEVYDVSPFQQGIWSSRYFQYGSWHGPHQLSLSFDSQSMTITGSGVDDIGVFAVDGTYSVETRRIGLTKKYQAGTGNQSQNLGHEVIIQATWNPQNNQFEGKWYVQTSKYHGEDKFELKLNEQQDQPPVYEKV